MFQIFEVFVPQITSPWFRVDKLLIRIKDKQNYTFSVKDIEKATENQILE